ncbi:MAG: hypothetical protein AAGF04_04960 [Chlamydiota bacterium]
MSSTNPLNPQSPSEQKIHQSMSDLREAVGKLSTKEGEPKSVQQKSAIDPRMVDILDRFQKTFVALYDQHKTLRNQNRDLHKRVGALEKQAEESKAHKKKISWLGGWGNRSSRTGSRSPSPLNSTKEP